MKQETKHIPALNPAPHGVKKYVKYEGKLIAADVFLVRGYNSMEQYAMVESPNSRPFTKVSIFKVNE